VQLLRIDSSARERSVTRYLTAAFRDAWIQRHPSGVVVERDLSRTVLPHITQEWDATFRSADDLTAAQLQYLTFSDQVIAELLGSDLIVIGAPMHNFTISWELKAWVDQIVRVGKTIGHGANGLVGLAGGRKVVVITARGGDYSPGSPRARLDHQEPYLRDIFAFIGIREIEVIHADRQIGAAAATSRAAALAAAERLGGLSAAPPPVAVA